ncbi:transcription termination factor MTERF8, chloroplastic-like [Zingiber officinale]|uniref:transcription termination factor MTERF8, chloroplastic-like n=1 Tax=Zingiber officinale TaxID=94328 RepID=UPI001C4AD759|nr:transcription termination factor MTERF8, chloroplastic-like [Zingiber officinale]
MCHVNCCCSGVARSVVGVSWPAAEAISTVFSSAAGTGGAMAPVALRFSFSALTLPYPSTYKRRPFLPFSALTASLLRHLCIARAATGTSPSAFWILRELHLDEKEADALLLAHPELELTAQESLRDHVLTLKSLGISDSALRRIVVRRPDVLSATEFGPFLDFVLAKLKGIKREKLERILATIHSEFLEGIIAGATLLLDHGFPGEHLGHVFNHVNIRKVFRERPLRDLEEMIFYLKRFGWPKWVLSRPMILNLDLHGQLIPRVEFFIELGGGDEAAGAALISKLPALLTYAADRFRSHLEFWRSVGLTDEELFKVALVYPNIFSVSKEQKLKPRIEFLRQCGMSAEDIFKFLVKAPLFMSLSFEKNLSKKLSFLVKIGHRHQTKELAWAFGAATRTSCENMQRVIEVLLSYGLSFEDILAMSKKHHQVLQYNHKSLEKKMEFLIEDMERDVSEILNFPAFLGYNLDDRIKRRYEIKRKIRGKGMSLNKLLSVSTERF